MTWEVSKAASGHPGMAFWSWDTSTEPLGLSEALGLGASAPKRPSPRCVIEGDPKIAPWINTEGCAEDQQVDFPGRVDDGANLKDWKGEFAQHLK